ncbi:MAG: pseudaminic acid biosynthesis-associated methylase [Candidatus Scalindua sp.]
MAKTYKTEQEKFWAGEFGTDYTDRNKCEFIVASNLNFVNSALKQAGKIESCIEFGANIGKNLKALKLLYPDVHLNAIEINKDAAKELSDWLGESNVFTGSIFDWDPRDTFDLVLIKGVLIHINPEKLREVYHKLHDSTHRYILLCEYYNPVPVTILYRGHKNRLFKRDYAGEILDQFPDLSLIDYGFIYHRDSSFPQDDINWFLLEKH